MQNDRMMIAARFIAGRGGITGQSQQKLSARESKVACAVASAALSAALRRRVAIFV
jgi:hypothetical protein